MTIKTRHVYFLQGFDPRGARHYYGDFKKQAESCKGDFEISSRLKSTTHSSCFSVQHDGCNTVYEFLHYDDIVRANWFQGVWNTIIQFIFYFKIYIFSDYSKKMFRISRSQVITGQLPFQVVLFCLFAIICLLLQYYLVAIFLFAIVGFVLSKGQILWLVRIYNFCTLYGRREVLGQNERINFFVQHIETQKKTDETIIVAHSIGTLLAVNILAKLNFKPKFLALGGTIPLMTIIDSATWFKDDLIALKNHFWLDYSSPIDGATFPLTHPLKHFCDAETPQFHILSPRFHLLYSTQSYKKIRAKWIDRHFLYLKTPELQDDYNFIEMVTSSKPLEAWLK